VASASYASDVSFVSRRPQAERLQDGWNHRKIETALPAVTLIGCHPDRRRISDHFRAVSAAQRIKR
jgi:hypothetical protein